MAEVFIHGLKIEVQADVRISAEEAEVLDHITSFAYLKEFHQKCSTSITPERMAEVVKNLRSVFSRITGAKRSAQAAMKEGQKIQVV